MDNPETIWRGLRYWVQEPTGAQHRGWNNWFVPYTVIKKTAKRITLRGDLESFLAFSNATGYPSGDKADVKISREKFEIESKIYHSRLSEYFYKVKPATDPDAPRKDSRFRSTDEFIEYMLDAARAVSPLAALGLPSSATKADIKRAYKRLARKAHPDGGGSHEAFLKLNEAYEQAMMY